MAPPSRHVASLTDRAPLFESDLGSVTQLTKGTLPLLNRLSVKRLLLSPGAIREPHWHANASELTYCLSGTVLVTILGDENALSTFTVGRGQMFHAPSGSIHHIENVGGDRAELIVGFRHEAPEDFSFHGALGAMSDSVLGNTFDLPADAFAAISRDTRSRYIVGRQGDVVIPPAAGDDDPLRFDVEAQTAPIESAAGSARVARSSVWPALADISMYSLRVTTEGMREPHWHPETAEMGYVNRGRARMTVQDPDGSTDTYDLGPGDVYFIPRAYPHHIENIGVDEFHFLVFFDRPTPGDIGFRGSGSAFSRGVVAATLEVPANDLPDLPFTPEDPLIVDRINPLDAD